MPWSVRIGLKTCEVSMKRSSNVLRVTRASLTGIAAVN